MATVTVACKHPHGLILRLFRMIDAEEPQPGGGTRTVRRAEVRSDISPVKINGYLAKYDPAHPPVAIGSSYALTHGVDKDFFDEWIMQNQDHAMVVNKLIWAHESADAVNAVKSELASTTCGFEPIDPTRLRGTGRGQVATFDPKVI